jgi:hypothetical protein
LNLINKSIASHTGRAVIEVGTSEGVSRTKIKNFIFGIANDAINPLRKYCSHNNHIILYDKFIDLMIKRGIGSDKLEAWYNKKFYSAAGRKKLI